MSAFLYLFLQYVMQERSGGCCVSGAVLRWIAELC